MKKGGKVIPWTPEQHRKLSKLSAQGVKPRNMQQHFPGRTIKAISHQLWYLGLSRHIYSAFNDASPLYRQEPRPEDHALIDRADHLRKYGRSDAIWSRRLAGQRFLDHGARA